MTPLQGEPPKIDFKLPRKAKKWLQAFRDFVMQSQPIAIDGGGVTINQTPKGRLLKADAASIAEQSSSALSHPLATVAANTSTTARVKIYSGYIAGIIADSSMDVDNDPAFHVTLSSSAGLKYIYAEVTVAYSTSLGTWSASVSEITSGTSVPSATSTKAYLQIARATVSATDTGFSASNIIADVSGNQWFSRYGNGTTYGDYNGLI